VTGPAAPAGEPPEWVLPLVVQIERSAPPARTDALEAAGRAVLAMLTDPRGRPGAPWAGPLQAWQDGRIRKVVRRARGAGWRRAAALERRPAGAPEPHGCGLYPPVPVDGWPAELARLQVGGTDLADPQPPAPPPPGRPVVWLAPGLEMTAGRRWRRSATPRSSAGGRRPGRPGRPGPAPTSPSRSAPPTGGRWDALLVRRRAAVRDAGFTEIAPGSCTAVADLPWLP